MSMTPQNAKELLSYTQALRIFWSQVIVGLIGFFSAAVLGVWGMALSAFSSSQKNGESPEITMAYFLLAAAVSSALAGLWRLYAHVLDNAIASLYHDLVLAEGHLGFPDGTGISKQFPAVFKAFNNAKLTTEQKAMAIKVIVDKHRIGPRLHDKFNMIAVVFVLLPLAPFFVLGFQLTTAVYITIVLWVVGIASFLQAFRIRQKKTRQEDIDCAIAQAKASGLPNQHM